MITFYIKKYYNTNMFTKLNANEVSYEKIMTMVKNSDIYIQCRKKPLLIEKGSTITEEEYNDIINKNVDKEYKKNLDNDKSDKNTLL